jgi:hypothetical protein
MFDALQREEKAPSKHLSTSFWLDSTTRRHQRQFDIEF